jgi:hypothetical protein
MNEIALTDRRAGRGTATDLQLVQENRRVAEEQLAAARENLKAARRRVVALEDAVANWTEFVHMAARARAGAN